MGHRIHVPAPSCAGCRYFAPNPHPSEHGACRRHAPRPADGGKVKAAIWPGVLGTNYCGDYALDHARHRDLVLGESQP